MVDNMNEMKKANGKGKMPVLGLVIAVIAAAGIASAMNAAKISNGIRKAFSSPSEYYQYVEQKNRDTLLEYSEKIYASTREDLTAQEKSRKVIYNVKPGDTLKALMGNNTLETMSLISIGKQDGDVTTGKLQLQLNDQDALSCNVYMDSANAETYMQIPELTESYLDMTSTMQEAETEANLNSSLKFFANLNDYLPETEDVTKLLTRYSDISIEHVAEKHKDSVKQKNNVQVSVGDISQKCTRLDVNCDEECNYEMSKKMLETMRDDDLIKQILKKTDPSVYQEFQGYVEESLTELEDSPSEADDAQMQMQLFADSEANIAGRTIRIKAGEETFTIQQKLPRNGSDFAYDLSVMIDDVTYLNVNGSGSIEHGILSGDFSISLDESLNEDTSGAIFSMEDLIQISVKKLDLNTLRQQGVVKGEFIFASDQIIKLNGYTLHVKMDGTKEKRKDELSVMVGSDRFLTLTMQEEEGEDPGVVKPDASAVKYDFADELQLSLYTSEIDLQSYLTDLRTKTSIDLTPFLDELGGY